MSSFIEIKTSAADIIGIANRLRMKGQSLSSTLQAQLAKVTALESAPETLPRGDEFTEEFLKTYHKSIEVPGEGAQPLNEAIKGSMPGLGEAMDRLGEFVVDAMHSYISTDDGNAAQINWAGGRN